MSESLSFLKRREFGRMALTRAGSAAWSQTALAPAQTLSPQTFIDVRQLGAAADGKTDDTAVLQRAIDSAGEKSGAVFIPPGVYLTRELHVRPGVALIGIAAWNYSGPGGAVLRLSAADATCLLNLTDARGSTVDGLALDGGSLGHNIHGMFTNRSAFGKHEDGFRIERCQVNRFTGDGLNLSKAWCFSVRHCMLAYNGGDGLSLRGWDGFIVDNWFSGNGRAGFAARFENASVTFTANRVEWNHEENMLVIGGDGYQITGNFFDRAGKCGLALRKGARPCKQFAITGNYFKRSGKLATAGTHDSAQVLLQESHGVTCTGNNFECGRDDGGTGVWSPSFGIVYSGLVDCVVTNNVMNEGACETLLVDAGGHGENAILRDNPGRVLRVERDGRG
jgi:pectate lyase-like protein/parallel beta helix pectate lyase-like protein